MKKLFLLLPLMGLLSFSGNTPASGSKGFVVVELFSSEGCSSCPPAEDVMEKLINKAKTESLPIYVIEFHVDYWNYAGWKDTFALRYNTIRQDAYKTAFKLQSLYTPEAVINGKTEMTGSDETAIYNAINKEMQIPAKVTIACSATKTSNTKLNIDYTITGNVSGCVINIALLQSGLDIKINGGENKGKTLHHDNVVRAFKSIPVQAGRGVYTLDVSHVPANVRLICYIQNSTDLSIVGVGQVVVNGQ